MIFKLKYPLFIIFFILMTYANAQEKHAKSALIEDIDILKTNLEEIHAGLYTYVTKQELDDWFVTTKESLKDSMTTFEFYKVMASLNSVIKNGHTGVHYPRFGKNFNVIPVQLYKYKNSFYVSGTFKTEYKDLIGKEIVTINGVSIVDVFNILLKNYTRDGNNLTFPSNRLAHHFGLAYSLAYGSEPNFKITIKDNNENNEVLLKSVLLDDEVLAHYKTSVETGFPNFKIENNVGILIFNSFDDSDLKKDKYKEYLQQSFKKVKDNKLENLIVDVRHNGGGAAVPTQELLSYLLDSEFVMYKDVYTITNKITGRKHFKNQGLFWLNLFSWLKVKKVDKDKFCLRNKEGSDTYVSKPNNFKGNLYILTNGNSFSATGEFTSFVEHNRDVVFVGEEVGGNKIQNTSGMSLLLTLPNSQQRVSVPIVLYEMNVPANNDRHGTIPDYWVKNTIEEELNNTDAVMEFTLDLIEKSVDDKTVKK